MGDEEKTKEELIAERNDARKQVSELRKSESALDSIRQSLSRSVETFRALFNQASDSIFLMEVVKDEGPIIIDANIAACETHGYERNELIGKPIRMLDTPETGKYIEDRAQRLLAGETMTFEGEHMRKDGSVFPVEVSAQLVTIGGKSYILAIDRDISERKKVERELRESREHFRTLFEYAGDAIFLVDEKGRFIDANRHACDVLGYSCDELLDMSVPDIDPMYPKEKFEDFVKHLEAGKSVTVEAVHRRKDGTTFPVEIRTGLIDVQGKTCLLSLARDITERKKAEEEREKLIRELNDALEEIKTLKVMVPLCAMDKKRHAKAIKEHYQNIAKEGKCPKCLEALKR